MLICISLVITNVCFFHMPMGHLYNLGKNIIFCTVLSCLLIFNNEYFAFDVTDLNNFFMYSFIIPHLIHSLQIFYFISEFPFSFWCHFLCCENLSFFLISTHLFVFLCLPVCFHIQKNICQENTKCFPIFCFVLLIDLIKSKIHRVHVKKHNQKAFERLMF